jgi:hypothetical protein
MRSSPVVAAGIATTYAPRMDHSTHDPGTVADCPDCRIVAYEPSWYKALREEHVAGRGPMLIPEANVDEGATVVIPDGQGIEVHLPDLEATRSDDEER